MPKISAFFLLLLNLVPALAFGSPELKDEFRATFYTHYVAGKCADNIRGLLQRAEARGADLRSARVGIVRNKGYLLSTTHRRNGGKEKLAAPLPGNIRFAPGISNFYYHVVIEKDGEIYDYDFGNEPVIVATKNYINRMFWEEPAVTEYTGLDALKWRVDYRIDFRPAADFIRDRNAPGITEFDLSDFYDSL